MLSLKGNVFITGSLFDQVLLLVLLPPLLLLPISSSIADVSEMLRAAFVFFGVTVVYAHILFFSPIGRVINDIIMLFITTSVITHGLIPLRVPSVSSISSPTILDSSSRPHGFFPMV